MAILNEVWVSTVADLLFQNDLSFLNPAVSHDDLASDGVSRGYRTVSIPQAGTTGGVSVNYSGSFPRSVEARTDTVGTYNIDTFLSPVLMYNGTGDLQVSYDKRASIVRGEVNKMAQVIGSMALYNWAIPTSGSTAGTNVVTTTGTGSAAYLTSGQTGTRKLVTFDDLLKVSLKLDEQNVPSADRYMVVPASMYYQILNLPEVKSIVNFKGNVASDQNLKADLTDIAGFTVFKRPDVVGYGSTGSQTRILPDSSGKVVLGAADNLAAIAFQADQVCKAFGGIVVDQGYPGTPEYAGGATLGIRTFMGNSPMRTDYKGICMLTQVA